MNSTLFSPRKSIKVERQVVQTTFYSTYAERRSVSETTIEFALLSFNSSEPIYQSQRIKLLDVIAGCNQLNVNALN